MKDKKNFIIRIITGLSLMAIVIPSIYYGGIYYLIVSSFFAIVGTYELINMFYKSNERLKIIRFILPIISGLIMVSSYLSFIKGITILPFLTYVLGILFSMTYAIFKKDSTASDILSCVLSLTYGGLLLTLAFSVEYLDPILSSLTTLPHLTGRMFAYLYSIVIATDVFAYFFGSMLGKHKLCPTISPKKSVEGAVFGLVLGGGIGILVGSLLKVVPLTNTIYVVMFVIASFVISFFVQIGDLIASKLKRTYGIKDYGFIFPGHGGVMDRFDSLIFSGALFYMIIKLVYILI